jgi:Xaa-Pro aminopeptidase
MYSHDTLCTLCTYCPQAVFPESTPGLALDTLARLPLWSEGLNYRHGTGHGVGAALNVHEGPQSISSRTYITTPLEASMVCSNEPGYYEEGGFGIRVENLMVVKEVATEFRWVVPWWQGHG